LVWFSTQARTGTEFDRFGLECRLAIWAGVCGMKKVRDIMQSWAPGCLWMVWNAFVGCVVGLARCRPPARIVAAWVIGSGIAVSGGPGCSAATGATHAIAMHGEPALGQDYPHFPHVRPDAPKGGTLRLGELGAFDSLNPFILKGVAPASLREYVFESLLVRSADEPFTLYAHIARAIELPDDRAWVTFHLDPDARFSDGNPITVEDVAFSWKLLKEKGQPYHRLHYSGVTAAEIVAPDAIRFTFADTGNREAPLLLGLMPILPRHLIDPATFDQTSLAAPVGSGPYRVADVDAGRSLTFERDPGWWARDKRQARGRFNFDTIRYEYFRDQTTLFEAFRSGDLDLRAEDDAGRWAEGYDFPAARDGRIVREELATGWPAGMTALVFNTRRPMFTDVRVRRALSLMLDFEWINQNLFHGHFARTQSFFERSELSSHGRPADAAERALLAPFPGKVPPEILEGRWTLPRSDGTGRNRDQLRAAVGLLREAGFVQEGGRMIDTRTRQHFAFQMMSSRRAEERLFQAFARNLAQVGIAVEIRTVDSAQRWARLKAFDFDMIQWTWGSSLSPGNEQRNRWGSSSADQPNALNFAGVSEPAIDVAIDALTVARERPAFVSAVRALDRLLLSGDYVIPLYHPKGLWMAWRTELQRSPRAPLSGFALDTWWLAQP
jgi:peptide/nickel transport system substrate-binding protein